MPSSMIAVLVIGIAVLPGSMYTWAYERQASAFGVTFADRTLRFIAISLIFHVVLGWLEFVLYRWAFTGESFGVGQFAAAWGAAVLLMAIPAVVGTVLGGLYSTRNSRQGWSRVRSRLSGKGEKRLLRWALGKTPAPRAWDHLFSDRPTVYLRIRTVDGTWLAGQFADHSYAGGYPHDTDILLEQAWEVTDDGGSLGQGLGYPLYVPAGQVAWLEIIRESDGEVEVDDAKEQGN